MPKTASSLSPARGCLAVQGWSHTAPGAPRGTQYLSIVLPELVSPHVVALEHGHRAVQPRHVQAQIIRADLLVCRVGKHLPRESACSDKVLANATTDSISSPMKKNNFLLPSTMRYHGLHHARFSNCGSLYHIRKGIPCLGKCYALKAISHSALPLGNNKAEIQNKDFVREPQRNASVRAELRGIPTDL